MLSMFSKTFGSGIDVHLEQLSAGHFFVHLANEKLMFHGCEARQWQPGHCRICRWLPSGYVKIAIENGKIDS